MKLIIDISNEGYDWIKNGFPDNEDKEFLIKAVKNGIPYDESPQGEWVKIGDIGLAYTCNKCGEVNVIPTNFCPNCGARMVTNENK